MAPVRILSHEAIQAKLRRMAFELCERNFGAPALHLVAASPRGEAVAAALHQSMTGIATAEVSTLPHSEVEAALRQGVGQGNVVVLVDDVLYTGRTLFALMPHLLASGAAGAQVAVLIDRGHRLWPVRPDVVGMELATTLQEHVRVHVDGAGTWEAFLE